MITPRKGITICVDNTGERTTDGGIVLPAMTKDRYKWVTVKAVHESQTELKPGDTVIINWDAGFNMDYENEKLLGVYDEDILSVVGSFSDGMESEDSTGEDTSRLCDSADLGRTATDTSSGGIAHGGAGSADTRQWSSTSAESR